jgi:hypothetical protein
MLTPVAPSTSNINDRLQCRRHLKAEEESGATAGTQDFDGRLGCSRQASFLAWAGNREALKGPAERISDP